MPYNTGLTADHYIVADLGAAAYAGLRSDDSVIAYFHIVRNLDQVVELGAAFNDGRADGSAVDSGIGADLYIIFHHHIADLRHLFETAVFLRSKTKSITAYHGACMNGHIPADDTIVVDLYTGMQNGIIAQLYIIADIGIGKYFHVVA